jgi:hypothetical protein
MSEVVYPHRIRGYKMTFPLLPKSRVVRQSTFSAEFLKNSRMFLVTTSVRKAKLMDAKEAAENAAADKQARSVEADTFRGVHLDPNAHHWDEVGILLIALYC